MRLGTLVGRDLARSKRRLAVVALAVAGSVALLVLCGGVSLGLYRGVVEPLLPKLPLDLLKVEPRTVSLGLLAFDAADLGGGLDDKSLDRLRKIEGVAAVYPVVGVGFPMRAEGGEGFLGRRLRADVFATGVDPALVRDDVAEGFEFEDVKDGKVPVLVARRLLDLYNTTVAPTLKKPRLSEDAVVGFEFRLTLGASYSRGIPDRSKVRSLVGQIVGFSDEATLVGVTIPEATLRRWNDEFEEEAPITGAYVRTRTPSDAGPVAAAIEQAGLTVDDTAKVIGAALAVAAGLGGLFAGTLLFFSAFAIAQTFFLLVAERRMELAILRAVGARQADLRQLVLIEALCVGAVGAVLGLVAGSALALGLDAWVMSSLPDLPFKPSSIVALTPGLLAAATGLGVLASVLGALVPAARAASANPASALRS